MMIHVYEIGTGRLRVPCTVSTIEDADLQAATQDAQCLWIEGNWNPDASYVFEGQVTDRSIITAFDYRDRLGLPPNTVVTVTNEVGDTLRLTDPSEPLVLTDPGHYRFDVVPPFPFLPATFEVDHG